jgi:hypothetical protein
LDGGGGVRGVGDWLDAEGGGNSVVYSGWRW